MSASIRASQGRANVQRTSRSEDPQDRRGGRTASRGPGTNGPAACRRRSSGCRILVLDETHPRRSTGSTSAASTPLRGGPSWSAGSTSVSSRHRAPRPSRWPGSASAPDRRWAASINAIGAILSYGITTWRPMPLSRTYAAIASRRPARGGISRGLRRGGRRRVHDYADVILLAEGSCVVNRCGVSSVPGRAQDLSRDGAHAAFAGRRRPGRRRSSETVKQRDSLPVSRGDPWGGVRQLPEHGPDVSFAQRLVDGDEYPDIEGRRRGGAVQRWRPPVIARFDAAGNQDDERITSVWGIDTGWAMSRCCLTRTAASANAEGRRPRDPAGRMTALPSPRSRWHHQAREGLEFKQVHSHIRRTIRARLYRARALGSRDASSRRYDRLPQSSCGSPVVRDARTTCGDRKSPQQPVAQRRSCPPPPMG
jgi:hypothetical protein